MKLLIVWIIIFVSFSVFIFHYQTLQIAGQSGLGSLDANSNTGQKIEFPATLLGVKNPETGQIEIKDFEIVNLDNMSKTNDLTSLSSPSGTTDTEKVDFSNLQLPCMDPSDQELSNPISSTYIILGKSQIPVNVTSQQRLAPISMEINDLHHQTKNDKFKLTIGTQRYKIEPLSINLICDYNNDKLFNKSIAKNQTYQHDQSVLNSSCKSFMNTYYKLDGSFENINNLITTSEKPHLKILFKKDFLSNKINGYISDESVGLGNFTVDSISLSCSIAPFDQIMLMPKERIQNSSNTNIT